MGQGQSDLDAPESPDQRGFVPGSQGLRARSQAGDTLKRWMAEEVRVLLALGKGRRAGERGEEEQKDGAWSSVGHRLGSPGRKAASLGPLGTGDSMVCGQFSPATHRLLRTDRNELSCICQGPGGRQQVLKGLRVR